MRKLVIFRRMSKITSVYLLIVRLMVMTLCWLTLYLVYVIPTKIVVLPHDRSDSYKTQELKRNLTEGQKEIMDDVLRIKNAKQALRQKLRKSARILCVVFSMDLPKHKERRDAVLKTWGKKCSILIFIMAGSHKLRVENLSESRYIVTLPTMQHYRNMWKVTQLAYLYIFENFARSFDWLVRADDDTYLIMENLLLFLNRYRVSDPYYYGMTMRTVPDNELYQSGGGAYVLSHENFAKLIYSFSADGCHTERWTSAEDLEISKCLAQVGIHPIDTRDIYGRSRFTQINPELMFFQDTPFPIGKGLKFLELIQRSARSWIRALSVYDIAEGANCCSDEMISFHYVTPKMMVIMDFLLYGASPFSDRNIWTSDNS